MKLKTTLGRLLMVAALLVPLAASANETVSDNSSLIVQGNQQWADGKLDAAKLSFERAVTENPRSAYAHMKLAGLLLASGKYADAIKTYQKTISLDGKDAKAWIGLGMAYLHAGQKELSQGAFDEAVRLDPSRKAQLAKLGQSSGH